LSWEAGYGLVGDDEASGSGSTISVHIESSYIFNVHDLEMKHVKCGSAIIRSPMPYDESRYVTGPTRATINTKKLK